MGTLKNTILRMDVKLELQLYFLSGFRYFLYYIIEVFGKVRQTEQTCRRLQAGHLRSGRT